MAALLHLLAALLLSEVAQVAGQLQNENDSLGAAPGPSPPSPGGTEDTRLVEYRHPGEEEYEPGVMNWILAVIMCAGLLGGLAHVYRVLRGGDSVALAIRNVPEGMRPVECGACHTTQYVNIHGRIFICFSCHSANRIPLDHLRMEETELVAPTGPLRKYEFRKGGVNFWQELRKEEIDGDGTGDCAERLLKNPPASPELAKGPPGSAAAGPEGDAGTNTPSGASVVIPVQAVEVSNEASPVVVGRQMRNEDDDEVVSCKTADEAGLPQCVVCLDNPGCMVLLPCAHGSVCEECVTRIVQNRASGGSHCPHCRSNIQTLVKIHEIEGEVAKGLELRIPMARPL